MQTRVVHGKLLPRLTAETVKNIMFTAETVIKISFTRSNGKKFFRIPRTLYQMCLSLIKFTTPTPNYQYYSLRFLNSHKQFYSHLVNIVYNTSLDIVH